MRSEVGLSMKRQKRTQQPKSSSVIGSVLIDRRGDGDRPYEILSLHHADGGASVTIGDIVARVGLKLKDRDRIKITIARMPGRKVLP
jgi:hypothetical protein